MKNPVILDAGEKRADTFFRNNTKKLKSNSEVIINNIDEDGIITTDYIISDSNQVKSATDNNGDFSTENDDIQMAIGDGRPFGADNPYFNKKKANKSQRDRIINQIIHNKYPEKGTDLLKIGGQLFLIDHTDSDDLYKTYLNNGEIPDGQGYGIRKKYNFAKLNKEDLHEIIRNIASEYNYSEESLRNRLQDLGVKPRNLLKLDIAAAIQRGIRDNALGNVESGRGGSQTDKNTNSIDSRTNQRENHHKEITQKFKTKLGEVYGFVDPKGDIYLDETVINPSHPLHEYTHLWDRAVAKHNPKFWKTGVRIFKKTSLWKEVENDDNYGKKWKSMSFLRSSLIFIKDVLNDVHQQFFHPIIKPNHPNLI